MPAKSFSQQSILDFSPIHWYIVGGTEFLVLIDSTQGHRVTASREEGLAVYPECCEQTFGHVFKPDNICIVGMSRDHTTSSPRPLS